MLVERTDSVVNDGDGEGEQSGKSTLQKIIN